ncbi:hypothetical protein RCL1_007355 [Eukaryota sp. TZLM3-RCL]
MSLFSCKTWWQESLSTTDIFAPGTLCVGNLDNSPDSQLKVVTGGLDGTIRIHYPQERDSSADDLLLEQNLGKPILQLALGRFVSSSPHLALAILHPRTLSVYLVSTSSGVAASGSYSSLDLLYEHQLPFNAFSMLHGPFGGSPSKDLICVQSSDSILSFYEHDKSLFNCYLDPTLFLCPGHLTYLPHIDSFLISSSAQSLYCYSFRSMSTSSHVTSSVPRHDTSSKTQGPLPEWKVSLGDHVVSVLGAKYPNQKSVIVCEGHLYFVNDRGDICRQNLLDCRPVCACLFPAQKLIPNLSQKPAIDQNILIGSKSRHILVYSSEGKLLWISKVNDVPHQILVSNFGNIEGGIYSLTDKNLLNIWYLGTDMTSSINVSNQNDCDFDWFERERSRLQLIVNRELGKSKVAKLRQHDVTIDIKVPTHAITADPDVYSTVDSLDFERLAQNFSNFSESGTLQTSLVGSGYVLQCCVHVTITSPVEISDLTVTANATSPVIVLNSSLQFNNVCGGSKTPLAFDVFYVCVFGNSDVAIPPSTLSSTLSVSYSPSNSNKRNTKTIDFYLPISLISTPISPVKNAEFKLNFELNQNIDLMSLFYNSLFSSVEQSPVEPVVVDYYSKMFENRGNSGGSVLSFRLCDSTEVSLFEKRSDKKVKIRIQSNNIESIYVFLQFILNSARNFENFRIEFKDPLPLNELIMLVDLHLKTRHQFINIQSNLMSFARCLRSCQKRLLVRFKENSAPPLDGIDVLFSLSHQEIASLTTSADTIKNCLVKLSCGLGSVVRLFIELVGLKWGLGFDSLVLLNSVMSPDLLFSGFLDSSDESQSGEHSSIGLGWEETVMSNISEIVKETAQDYQLVNGQITCPEDTSQFGKLLSLLLEKISRTGSLNPEESG